MQDDKMTFFNSIDKMILPETATRAMQLNQFGYYLQPTCFFILLKMKNVGMQVESANDSHDKINY